jgi:hypothetical protein
MSWNLRNCCATSYEMFFHKRLIPKERNSAVIMVHQGPTIQVSLKSLGRKFSQKPGNSSRQTPGLARAMRATQSRARSKDEAHRGPTTRDPSAERTGQSLGTPRGRVLSEIPFAAGRSARGNSRLWSASRVVVGEFGAEGGPSRGGVGPQNFFKHFGIEQKVPDHTAIRTWLLRLGIAELERPVERADDWVWIVDHSNQIGKEKVLCILGIRASKLPPPGTALRHGDLRVLKVLPGTSWKREDMARVYKELAEEIGPPRVVLSDGAVELQAGALVLKTTSKDTIVLRDFKHFAANEMKSLIGKTPRFETFHKELGPTRSRVQQTELAHLTPPSPKPKARFMNLKATLIWADVVLWLLRHPKAESRKGLASKRLKEKFGWLCEYENDLAAWQECQEVISASVTFINEHGVFPGAEGALREKIAGFPIHPTSRELADRLLKFVKDSERLLKDKERLPLSTEILESCFSKSKQMERQHAKGGFTSLLGSFAALLHPTTPEEVTKAFAKIKVKDVRGWIEKNLGTTLGSRRRSTYQEHKKATKRATKQTTTA